MVKGKKLGKSHWNLFWKLALVSWPTHGTCNEAQGRCSPKRSPEWHLG
jgi:hypothetical protein